MPRRLNALLCCLLLVLVPTLVTGEDPSKGPEAALRAAEQPLRDQAWAEAAKSLRAVREQFPSSPQALEAWVLESRALLRAGQARASLDVSTAFLAAHGEAAWAGRMQANVADAYTALSADGDAAKALRARAEFLTGIEQRARIGALYVALADRDFDGYEVKDDLGRPQKTTDFAAALAAYRQALEVGVAPADELRVRGRIALSLEKTGDWAGAAAAWDALVGDAGKGPGADPEAWLVGRGRARLRMGQGAEARKDLRDALETWPQGKLRLETLRLLAEERFLRAQQAPTEEERDLAFEEGAQYLRRAIAEHRDDPEVPAVQAFLAEAYESRGAWEKAAAEWRSLVERLPTHASAPTWRNRLAAALAAAGRWDDAVTEWKAFLSAFPNHPLWQEVQARIPQARFEKGTMLASLEEHDAAIAAWRAFAEEYPTDALAPEALLRVGNLLRARKDYDGAIAAWRGVTGRYASSPQAPQAWFLVASTLEDDLGRLEDAVKEYEALLKAHAGYGPALERLARLKGKHLEVRGERVVGSEEPAVLKVVTRNLPSLSVRVYKLGLEDYFRRKQTVQGVESIQVEIVKPDATAEWKVDPYAPFALVQQERAVPTTGPGAYVVVAGDDDLTSTTLLLVSDVETVVKSAAGRQVFVWARHRTTGAPVPGARVLVSDGTTVFAEGTTGADGVYVLDTDRTGKRVLVLAGASPAASEWEPGPSYAEGWQSKAHVATDRPVYRPGQTMKFRAIYRRADGGSYRVPAVAKGVAVLVNPRGAEVERKAIVASPQGVFDGDFTLDGEAALGDWIVRLDVDDRSFPGSFRVLEYRKPEFGIAVVPGQPTYRTGEEVKATIRLTYTFGGPVVGAPVDWEVVRVPHDFTPSAVNDYSWYFQDADALARAREAARTAPQGAVVARGSLRTDDRGEGLVTFATTERDEDAEYVVRASAIDVTRRFVADEGRIPVVRRDSWAVVTTDRRVYRPKQELRATVQTVDANQSPVSKSGELLLVRVRRTPVPPTPGPVPMPRPSETRRDVKGGPVRLAEEEIEVSKLPLTTGQDGRAEARLAVPGPGVYRARWVSTDARGARVTAYQQFDVAGEAEDLAKDARLVVAKETYTEGDRAEILVQSPVTRLKALLTFEGEKVLAHRLVELESSSQLLDVPVEGIYAPNVVVKIAIPAKDRLLEAEDEIVVFRFLKVEVTPSKATALPGEDVAFDVVTTDAAGHPIAAEVGLSVVDDALFAVAPDRTPAIRPFFYDRKRLNRVVTSSSVGFRTYGTTRETNKDLLANAEARDGDPNRMLAREALRIARAALQRGDFDTAAQRALAAAAADPESWDARNLLNELRERPDAQAALRQFDDARLGELRKEMAAAKDAPTRDRLDRLSERARTPGAAAPTSPAPAPRPSLACGSGKCGSGMPPPAEAGELLDKNESEEDAWDGAGVEDEKLKSVTGSGGGAGGGYGARKGGSRTLRARGGGGRRAQEPGAVAGYAFEGGDGAPAHDAHRVLLVESYQLGAQVEQLQAQLRQAQQIGPDVVVLEELRRHLDVAAKKQLEVADQLAVIEAQTGFLGDVPIALPASLRRYFADTAAWSPHVVTDAAGKASVKVLLPDNLTRWRATARGVAGESLVGEGKAFVTARRDVLLRLDAPRFLVQGDEATIPAAVHNHSAAELTAEVKVSASGARLSGQDERVTVPAGGRALVDRPLAADATGPVRLEATVSSAAGGDQVEAGFATLPKGVRVIEGRSGLLSTSGGDLQETFLEVPAGAISGATRLSLALYPSYDAAIFDALDFLKVFPYGCVEQTVHRYVPVAWARRALAAIGTLDAARFGALDETLRGAVARLNNLQHADGSFGWWRGGGGNVSMTAFALVAYVEAMRADVPGAVDAVNRTAAALQGIVRRAPDDAQAIAHWALALSGRIDEEAYQVTFRRRNEELSVPGLAWLAMAARALGREFDEDDLVRLLLARKVEEKDTTRWKGRKDDCFVGSDRLATALAVRALLEAGVAEPAVERGMRWLLDQPREGGFGTTLEASAFVGACAAWVERNRPAAFGGTIAVLLDGTEVRQVAVRPGGALDPKDRRFLLDVGTWAAGRHALGLRLAGQGEVRWAARLEATVASDELPAEEHGVRIERLYLDADLPPVEGAELPVKPGHEILRPSARPKVEARSRDRAGTGERILVRLTVTAPRDLEYVMVEDPLPAGFEVLDETARGPFDWQERRDDRQVFFVSSVKTGPVVLSYVLQAVHLGAFTALPTRVHAMYLPEVFGRAAGHRFTIGTGSSKAGDAETPPTPDEVFALGMKMLAKKQWAEAARVLAGLKALPLRDEIAVEIEAALLRTAIETKEAKEIVRAREELVRRDPSRVPSDLESARAIAGAYADVGASGVAATLYRDLIARAFGLEAGWADTLTKRGREVEGLAVLGTALEAYPVNNRTAAAALQRAARYRDLRRPEGVPGKAGAPMDEESLAALRDVAAHFAETPLAGPASYAIIDTLRRTRDLDAAVVEAVAFPRRFPTSPFVDDALFFLMDSYLAKFEGAPGPATSKPVLEAAARLTQEKFRRPDGAEAPSEFRPRAYHTTARVRHVLGDLEGAIAAYREAAPQIADAREALAYLTEGRLELPEAVHASVAGAASFPLKYRNVGEVAFKAYPVDLQVLFAVRRTLEGLNRIDLSGITPAKEWTEKPAGGGDHAWHEASVGLPLGQDAAGVFLVVAKAGDLEASTIVVKTDLRVVLQSIGEKVRVHVTDGEGKGVRGAFVTVSDGSQIKARGVTDGRGVFEAPGVGSKPFVVANLEDRYGMAR